MMNRKVSSLNSILRVRSFEGNSVCLKHLLFLTINVALYMNALYYKESLLIIFDALTRTPLTYDVVVVSSTPAQAGFLSDPTCQSNKYTDQQIYK